MGLKKDTTLHIALNTDCGILPVYLTRAIEVATLHARLLTVHSTREARQIHCNLINHSESLLHTDCITEQMRQAHLTLDAKHLWSIPPPLPPHQKTAPPVMSAVKSRVSNSTNRIRLYSVTLYSLLPHMLTWHQPQRPNSISLWLSLIWGGYN